MMAFLLKNIKKVWSFLLVLMMFVSCMPGAAEKDGQKLGTVNVLKNSSFEEKSGKPASGNPLYFLESWTVALNTGVAFEHAELSEDAYDGKYSLKFTAKNPNGSISADQKVKVSPKQEVTASIYTKGTKDARAFLRFFMIDEDGKSLAQYKYLIYTVVITEEWKPFIIKFKVPEGVNAIVARAEIRVNPMPVEVYFDKFEMQTDSSTVLENEFLRLDINPLVGGCIDSFVSKKSGFDFTVPNLRNSPGGMGLDIIPGTMYPGFVRTGNYALETLKPAREIKVSRTIHDEELKGLQIAKTFKLEEGVSFVNVNVELFNNSDKNLEFEYRVQNCISVEDGTFTWPFADWLQAFRRTPQSIKTMNSVVTERMRLGWSARTYDKLRAVLLFKFPVEQISHSYSWLDVDMDTMEWYYRKIALEPGQSWKTEYSIEVLPAAEKIYTGGLKDEVVYVKGITLPELKSEPELPEIMKGYFPFGIHNPTLVTPASAGSNSDLWINTYSRAMRDMAYNYFNFVFFYLNPGAMDEFVSEDGKAVIGELARKYDMMLAPNNLLTTREDVDVNEFRPVLAKRIEYHYTPKTLQFIKNYKDRILCFFTGDEILSHNIPCMLEAHDALQKIIPDRVGFPYQIISNTEYLPYVSVFLGDFYPILKDSHGGRNPWRTSLVIGNTVKRAGENPPVWFMPSGFHFNQYLLPTAVESRLMAYLAVANGARGIVYHGPGIGRVPWYTIPAHMKYYYPVCIYSNGGERTEAWYALRDCAKQLTAVGSLLYYASPEWDFTGAKVKSSHFKSIKNFYEGPSITVNSLKLTDDSGRVLVVINQDTVNEQSGEISFDEGLWKLSLYDLTDMKKCSPAETLKVKLRPGDAKFYLLGQEKESDRLFAEVCGNRYMRERIRYAIDAECASNNNVDIKDAAIMYQHAADKYAAKQNEEAYIKILQAYSKLHEMLEKTELGQAMCKMEKARELLDEINFMLSTHFDMVVPPEDLAKAPQTQLYKNPDTEMQKLIDAIREDAFGYWTLDREMREGKFNQIHQKIEKLLEGIPVNVKATADYLKANAHKIKVNNPYGE